MPTGTALWGSLALCGLGILTLSAEGFAQAAAPIIFERGWQQGMPATVTGELTVLATDDFERGRSELMHFIRDSRTGRSLRIRLAGDAPRHWRSGATVSVSGRVGGEELFVLAASTDPNATSSSTTTPSTSITAASGDQKTLVIVANFSDKAVSCSTSQVSDLMFTSPLGRSIDDLYRESSWGQTSLSGTVAGPFTLDHASTDACDLTAWATAANVAASASVNVGEYPRKVYVMPTNSCPAAGVADVGVTPSRSWVFTCGLPDVYAHELGHNLGMHHASTPTGEYQDVSDFMGQSEGMIRQVNAPHKLQLGWLPDTQVATITQDGRYDVAPLELDPGSVVTPQALKIHKADTNEHYYVSYRAPVGFDAVLACCEYLDRLSVHRWSGAGRTTLLAVLDDGEMYSDPATGFSVTQVSHHASSATADVRVGNTCGVAAPTVSMTPRDQTGSGGILRTYDVSVVNNDPAGCPVATFSLERTAPTSWAANLSTTDVVLSAGDIGLATIAVTPPSDAQLGTYPIDARVQDTRAGAPPASIVGSYVVTACVRNAPDVSVSPFSQTGLPGSTLDYTVSVTNTDSGSCGTTTFGLTTTAPAGWSALPYPSSLTLAPGGTGTASLRMTSSVTAGVGDHAVSVSVFDPGQPQHVASGGAVYVVRDAVPPTSPANLKASVTRRGASLTWSAATDNVAVSGYRIWRNGAIIATSIGTSWVDTTLSQGVSYTYSVLAFDASGNDSPHSNSVTIGRNGKNK